MGLLDDILKMLGLVSWAPGEGPPGKGGNKPSSDAPAASAAPEVDDDPAMGDLGGNIHHAPKAEVADGEDDDASDWEGPGDWAPKSWRKGAYTWEQADELDYEDFEDGDPTPPSWHSKRSNPTKGFSTLHFTELNNMKSGYHRRMFAVYGIPVGWGKSDAEESELRERIDAIKEGLEEGNDDILSEYGFLDEEHFEYVADRAVPGYRELGDVQAKLDEQMMAQKQAMNDRLQGELAAEIEPVEGVTLEQWAAGQASLSQGGTLDAILSGLGIDQPTWDRVSEEWNARMSRDSTATIATAYGAAFTGAGAGQFGAAGQATGGAMLDASRVGVDGDEPISFEKWIEITEAQNAGTAQGRDPAEVLAEFGMTPADWGTAGGWWSQKFAAEAVSRLDEYNRLSEKYRQKYATGDADDDVEF
jgi:hypothetical protein